eukprot:CAMPEP_0197884354 /NCGR_PEP_ID=MMETSP1439-20131203/10837_1 /TAXON_ID=66791 /ORGANISM="Gonyaulax spinifera, Strain CCMP409" /LENGTH=109 /DNA_ID=CAMNT_0043504083 /DNA_START=74 /DNA_END=403 /DNA_ORIENTATION=+
MAVRRSSALLLCAACTFGLWAFQAAFVAPPGSNSQPALRGAELQQQFQVSQKELAKWTAAGAIVAAPGAAEARLPDEFVIFAPIVDVMPVLPFFFFLLAFLWQASVGFR